ncbi:MAG: RNA methyltransferase [Alphaproteobacteria bacterium]|nr:RNA methyltransferase [Alphaproteobacteria bacterium]
MDNARQTRPPVVILARPQMGENIGAAARAMMNCGLSDLRLVAPRDGWPNAAALPMAAGGKPIIETAQVFDTVAAATADISFLAATSARRRDLAIRSLDPRGAAEMIVAHTSAATDNPSDNSPDEQNRAALLFGPEASGLDNDEVVLADILVTASLNPAYPSLNLAQGVLLMAWEWRMAVLYAAGQNAEVSSVNVPSVNVPSAGVPGDAALRPGRASVAERDYFYKRLEMALDEGGFFTAPDMVATVKRNIRALFNRAAPSKQEISTLHGILQALTRNRKT